MTPDLIRCPFCDENDFDKIGLKAHLLKGWCPVFEDTDDVYPPKRPVTETGAATELERYRNALYQANGRLIQLDQEPVKLEYGSDSCGAG